MLVKTFVAMVVIASVGEDICGHGAECECWGRHLWQFCNDGVFVR